MMIRTATQKPLSKNYMMATQEKIEYVGKKAEQNIVIMLGSILDIADGYIFNCIQELKKAGLYKQQIKQQTNKARAEYERVRKWIMPIGADRKQLHLDLYDIVEESVKSDVMKLYYSIKQVCDKYKVQGANYKALIETIWSLLDLAMGCYKAIMSYIRIELHASLEHHFSFANPSGMFRIWDTFTNSICKYDDEMKHVFANDKNIKLATEVLHGKLCSLDALEEHCRAALKLNPNLVAEYKQEHPEFNGVEV